MCQSQGSDLLLLTLNALSPTTNSNTHFLTRDIKAADLNPVLVKPSYPKPCNRVKPPLLSKSGQLLSQVSCRGKAKRYTAFCEDLRSGVLVTTLSFSDSSPCLKEFHPLPFLLWWWRCLCGPTTNRSREPAEMTTARHHGSFQQQCQLRGFVQPHSLFIQEMEELNM